MNNNAFCPISFKKIDENVARLNGFFTVVLLFVFLVTSSILPVLLLLADFLVRGIEKPQFSPLALLSKFILSRFNAKPHLINAGPKIFAARIGLLFSLLITLSVLFGLNVLPLFLLWFLVFVLFLKRHLITVLHVNYILSSISWFISQIIRN